MAIINGDALDNVIDGTNGDDTLNGLAGNDVLNGFDGFDSLNGGDGADTLRPGLGNDVIDGGAGFDFLDYSFEFDPRLINLDTGQAVSDVGQGFGVGGADFDIFSNIEGLFGSQADDFLSGDVFANFFAGGAGVDSIGGADGDDRIFGDDGDDFLFGEDGDDFIDGGFGDDVIDGGFGFDIADYSARAEGFDFFVASSGLAQTLAATENDTLIDIDKIVGSAAGDILIVDSSFIGDDGTGFFEFDGGAGDDLVVGNGETRLTFSTAAAGVRVDIDSGTAFGIGAGANVGADTFSGVNSVNGSSFDDILFGADDAASESFRGQAGNDFIDGRAGDRDRADYRNSPNGVDVDLAAGLGFDGFGTVDFLFNIEDLRGSDFDDALAGDGGANRFRGRAGDDLLDGRGGFDTADYRADAAAAITVSLGAVATVAGGAEVGTDALVGIERVFGSDFADSFVADGNFDNGDASGIEFRNLFNAFRGGGGDDTITGNGFTRVEYIDSDDAIDADLSIGIINSIASLGNVGVDSVAGVFEVRGSDFADNLIGSDIDPLAGFESFIGESGADFIDGAGGFDRVSYITSTTGVFVDLTDGSADDGFGFVDTLVGIEDVEGSDFDDILVGDSGANFLESRRGNDFLDGRFGRDLAIYDSLDAAVSVDLSAEFADKGANGVDELIGIENIDGTAFDDTLKGSTIDNDLFGLSGNDRLIGLTGADILDGGDGADTLFGNSGDDILIGGAGNDRLSGSFGADDMRGGLGDDIYFVDDQADIVTEFAGEGFDTMIITVDLFNFGQSFAGPANVEVIILDTDVGVNGATLVGVDGFDARLIGGDGVDILIGGNADDILEGGGAADVLRGLAGDDLLKGGAGDDNDLGSAGVLQQNGGVGLDGGAGDDVIVGGAGDDVAFGGIGFDRLNGQFGDDVLIGGAGADRLIGGAGDDKLFANQRVEGPALSDGAEDRFLFSDVPGFDLVFGFVDGEDKIDLRGVNLQTGQFTSFTAVALALSEVDGDAVITINEDAAVTISGVPLAAIDATDFIL